MSAWMLSIVSLLYAGTAVDLWIRNDFALSIAFACYAIANCALIAAIR
jgi:hypothetical protein